MKPIRPDKGAAKQGKFALYSLLASATLVLAPNHSHSVEVPVDQAYEQAPYHFLDSDVLEWDVEPDDLNGQQDTIGQSNDMPADGAPAKKQLEEIPLADEPTIIRDDDGTSNGTNITGAVAPEPDVVVLEINQIKLNADSVENFLDSFRDISQAADELEKSFEGEDLEALFEEFQLLPDNDEAKSLLNELAQNYFFKDYADWLATAQSVLIAHQELTNPLDAAPLTRTLDEILIDPDLTAEEKAELKEQIDLSLLSLESMRPIRGNVEIVKPFAKKIDAIFYGS